MRQSTIIVVAPKSPLSSSRCHAPSSQRKAVMAVDPAMLSVQRPVVAFVYTYTERPATVLSSTRLTDWFALCESMRKYPRRVHARWPCSSTFTGHARFAGPAVAVRRAQKEPGVVPATVVAFVVVHRPLVKLPESKVSSNDVPANAGVVTLSAVDGADTLPAASLARTV